MIIIEETVTSTITNIISYYQGL